MSSRALHGDDTHAQLDSLLAVSRAVAMLIERVENLSCLLDEVKGDLKGHSVDPKAFEGLVRRVEWLERKMLYAIGAIGALNIVLYVVATRLIDVSWGH